MIKQDQKVAIVTGGASGIGLAIAKEYVANNIYTIVIGRDQAKLDNAKGMLGDLCETISFDLGKLDEIPGLVEAIVQRHGKIDILVNNAGINMKKEFFEVTDEDFMSIIQTNLLSVFALSREVVKAMLPNKRGCIINISSMAAQYGIPKVIAYTASKTALDGMTKAMAVELSPKGIRVNSIAPGFIATDMSAKALNSDPERKNKVMSRTPMGYLGEPKDIGTTAVFLASEGAKYITGTIIPVDGGNSVGF
ncbi:SDR family NAD(P)-dependent oxidoreductase [Desertivirga arenae]|uniref:SDR family NAD(P)-dependent oxidoreductase n=1 Tax=Desertivirga arenae TaxID=2810309 RepID=UPI001F605EAE|nr:SDR family oxidoreductase [Pedobacter sp. SYSU D00823]